MLMLKRGYDGQILKQNVHSCSKVQIKNTGQLFIEYRYKQFSVYIYRHFSSLNSRQVIISFDLCHFVYSNTLMLLNINFMPSIAQRIMLATKKMFYMHIRSSRACYIYTSCFYRDKSEKNVFFSVMEKHLLHLCHFHLVHSSLIRTLLARLKTRAVKKFYKSLF